MTRKELRSYFAFPLVYMLSGIFLVLAGYYAYTDLVFFVTIAFSHDIMQNYWQMLFCGYPAVPAADAAVHHDAAVRGGAKTRHDRAALHLSAARRRNTRRQVPGVGRDLHHDARADAAVPDLTFTPSTAFPLFPLVAGYLGLLLLGCAFIACGVFISSLCESQVMAGMGTITLLLFFWILNWNEAAFDRARGSNVLRAFSLFDQFGGFAKGVIDLDHVTYFIFFIVFFLFLTHALDGGTQVDGPALKDSPAVERRSIWLNYAVLSLHRDRVRRACCSSPMR